MQSLMKPNTKSTELNIDLENIVDQMELEETMRDIDDSDDDYEEVEDFDPEFSVFGSEARNNNRKEETSDTLGKRSRQSFERILDDDDIIDQF